MYTFAPSALPSLRARIRALLSAGAAIRQYRLCRLSPLNPASLSFPHTNHFYSYAGWISAELLGKKKVVFPTHCLPVFRAPFSPHPSTVKDCRGIPCQESDAVVDVVDSRLGFCLHPASCRGFNPAFLVDISIDSTSCCSTHPCMKLYSSFPLGRSWLITVV